MKYLLTTAITIILLHIAYAGDRKTCVHHGPGEDIYKHYKGTIGTHKVLLDLRYGYCGSSNYGGSYIHDLTTGTTTRLIISEPASFAHNVELTGTESRIEDYWWDNMETSPQWRFTIDHDRLKGQRISADKKVKTNIDLAEDPAATAFQMVTFTDSAKTMRPCKPMFTAYYDHIGVSSSATVNEAIMTVTNGKALGASNMEDLPSALAQKVYTDFKTMYESLPADTSDARWKRHTHYYATLLFPVYNDKGIVALEYRDHNDNYSMINIDVQTGRPLTHAAVFGRNDDKLLAMVREEYQKHPDKGLAVDSLSHTNDFMLVAGGVIFRYSYTDQYHKDRNVFLPYKQLLPLLAPDFKKRMGL